MINYLLRPDPFYLTGINWGVCLAVVWACVCRMRLTSKHTKLSARIVYSITFVVMLVSAFRGPLLGHQVTTWWPIVLTLCTWLILLINISAWRNAPPPNMQKNSDHVDLGDPELRDVLPDA